MAIKRLRQVTNIAEMGMVDVMNAALFTHPGAPVVLETLPVPTPRAGEALVRILASAVNPLDLKIRAADAAHAHQPLPAVLGLDLAGVVEAVGDGVTRVRVGDEVYGLAGGVGGRQGTLAEYIAAPAELLARKPKSLTMREAASLPLAVITAWEGIVDRANVHAGQTVLVQGGGGGVGRLVMQIAKARGAAVRATSTPRHREALGDAFIEAGEAKDFDIVFDTLGGAVLDASFKAIRRFGYVVSILGWGAHALAPLSFKGGTYSGVFTLLPLLTGEGGAHHGEILEEVARLVDAGALTTRVDPRRFSLANVDDAYRAMADACGKIVVDL